MLILALLLLLVSYSPYPSCVKNGSSTCASMMTGTLQRVSSKNILIFVRENLGIWGLIGTGVKFLVESAILGIADSDLPIHYTTFMELR